MSKLDQIRAAKKILDELEVDAAGNTQEKDAANINHLASQVAQLRDANVILRARLGEKADDGGGEVANALRAAAVLAFRRPDDTRTAILWLKSCGWGEQGGGRFHDPVTKDQFLLQHAIDIQGRRALDPFKTLLNNQ